MMSDREHTAVVTGASAGVGKEAARVLASQGWRVIGTGRDPARCAAAEAEIGASAAGGGSFTMIRADLSLFADVRRLAGEIAALTDRIDLLANNAGGMPARFEMTAEGFEANFAGNHLGPFLLTELLLPLLRAAAKDAPPGAVRIINTSSDASEFIDTLNLDDMQNLGNYSNGLAYCSGKLANVLHARALASRLAGEGIVAHSFHPGTIDFELLRRRRGDHQGLYRYPGKAPARCRCRYAAVAGDERGGRAQQRRLLAPAPAANAQPRGRGPDFRRALLAGEREVGRACQTLATVAVKNLFPARVRTPKRNGHLVPDPAFWASRCEASAEFEQTCRSGQRLPVQGRDGYGLADTGGSLGAVWTSVESG